MLSKEKLEQLRMVLEGEPDRCCAKFQGQMRQITGISQNIHRDDLRRRDHQLHEHRPV